MRRSAHRLKASAAFLHADACDTGLPRASFDLVYCRFLLIHLPQPTACILEMLAVLKPGGERVSDLVGRLGPTRGLDYTIGKDLSRLAEAAGMPVARHIDHQPACITYEHRLFPKWSVEEAGSAFVGAGLITEEQLANTIVEMQQAVDTPGVKILAPRMYFVSGVKAWQPYKSAQTEMTPIELHTPNEVQTD